MEDPLPGGGAIPSWVLNQANPACDKCPSIVIASHKRWREKSEAIRMYENLNKYTEELELKTTNFRLAAERTSQHLEQKLERSKAALQNSITLEEHEATLQALVDEKIAKSREEFTKEKQSLLAQLTNKNNELKSEKEHKELLLKKAIEMQAEMNTTRKEKAQDERSTARLHEESENKLRDAIKTKDQEIMWLRRTLKEREDVHKQAMQARSDLIDRAQATTPSSQRRAAPNRNTWTDQASPTAPPPLQTPTGRNGTAALQTPSVRTPQHQRRISQKNVGRDIGNSTTTPQNCIYASRRNSIPQLPSATTPLQTGRRHKNVLTSPSKNHEIDSGQPATPGSRLTGNQHRASGPWSTPDISQPVNWQLAPELRNPHNHSNSTKQLFYKWFGNKSLRQAQARYASGQTTDLDLALLSNNRSAGSSAIQKHFSATMNNIQGPAVQKEFLENMQRLQAQKQRNATMMDLTTQMQPSSMIQSPAYNAGLPRSSTQHENSPAGRLQNGSPKNGATSAMQNNTEPQAQTNTAPMSNPTQQKPALFSQNPMEALYGIDQMRRSTIANVSTQRLPQKPAPSKEWNSPANSMDLFQGNVPTFPQPISTTLFQQSANQGYEFIDEDLEILGATTNTAVSQKDSNRRPQTGTAGGVYPPHPEQHGTQMHPSSQGTARTRPPLRAASRSPSRSPSRANVHGVTRINQPKDIPDGGYRGVVCKHCHHEWWNTWCDDENSGTCFNCCKNGVSCERPRCPEYNTCKNPKCKGAHERDNFTNTFEMENKRTTMKRKNKMTDGHDEPPRKRMKEQGGDPAWKA